MHREHRSPRARRPALLLAVALAACGGGGGGGSPRSSDTPPGDTPPVTGGSTSGHAVSGVVSGAVKAGVTVTLAATGGTRTTTTAADGTYAFAGVADGDYTLTPARAGILFDPGVQPVTVTGEDVSGQDFVANRDPAVLSTGCAMTFGPPISATTGCIVESIAPSPFDAWSFGISPPTGGDVAAAIDLGLSAVPAMGAAYALGGSAVHDAYFQVVYAGTGDQWFGGKSDASTQGTLTITVDSQTDPIDYGDHTSYRPHGELQATIPHAFGPGSADVAVSATF